MCTGGGSARNFFGGCTCGRALTGSFFGARRKAEVLLGHIFLHISNPRMCSTREKHVWTFCFFVRFSMVVEGSPKVLHGRDASDNLIQSVHRSP